MPRKLVNAVLFTVLGVIVALFLCYSVRCYRRRRRRGRAVLPSHGARADRLQAGGSSAYGTGVGEELLTFPGGEGLTVAAILEAPGEVVAKSAHSTLYRAGLSSGEAVALLRFLRPVCSAGAEEAAAAARLLGAVQHPNLVPIRALYVGPRGEKLLVHPFYAAGSLRRFLQEGINDSQRWEIICKLSIGIVKGLDHLHTRSQKPIIHGNLKTSNIMLDADFQPRVSDFGLYLLLNPAAAQDMLETAAMQGYKAPELIKMREVTRESDVYSLGVILLEMLAQKEVDGSPNARDIHLPASFKDLVLERKIADAFGSGLIQQSKNSGNEAKLNAFFELATACCNPSPSLRPDSKRILKRLEEISR
ncbi:probably inactive leucine-rich repeat receptor-like protein kinase IMK2 [Triticum dicoccoides]|uniref:probably inactive leucine-rich repeat receptor-like protein kinase IMK2 n=1 Tax=Triticum dicoccoides TaxID=85692 RepID=UPI0018906EB6|nr:probably inactive leucine-rich repeat receptor-like protein kinase IMK2 [Triticum dicoccoides]